LPENFVNLKHVNSISFRIRLIKFKIMQSKILIGGFSIWLIFLGGCSDEFLDRQPLDQIVSTNFYQTEKDAMKALIAVYDALQYQSSPGISWSPFLTMSDILSDHAYAGGGDANDGLDENEFNTFNIPTTNVIVHSLWAKNYTGIYRANLLLEKITDIEAGEDFKNQVIGECKFLRAYFYFELVKLFENIPLLVETIKGPSQYSQMQNSSAEVYNQIALDLTDAIDVLPELTMGNNNGRITKWSASALLARAYLFYKGVYDGNLQADDETVDEAKVLSYLEELIANSTHSLIADYNELFKLKNEMSSESVFEIAHGDSPAWWDWGYLRGSEGNLAAQMQGPRVTGSDNWNRGWSFAPVTQKLVDALKDDPRLKATVLNQSDLDGNLVKGYQHTGYFSNKYSSDAEHWGSDGQFEHNRTCNYRAIRYADVLLMAAELGSSNAQQYLDEVRARVGLESKPATLENILKERELELALEGIRYFDLLRQGLDVASTELNEQSKIGPNYEGDEQIFNVNFNPAIKGFLPIPQTEVDLSNGVFKQNMGY